VGGVTNKMKLEDLKNYNVENMTSPRGNLVQNQFVITTDEEIIFKSYDTIICAWRDGVLYLNGEWWDYSATTRKYFKEFVNNYTTLGYVEKKQFLKLIDSNDRIEVLR
jgi:hypothetical protein